MPHPIISSAGAVTVPSSRIIVVATQRRRSAEDGEADIEDQRNARETDARRKEIRQ